MAANRDSLVVNEFSSEIAGGREKSDTDQLRLELTSDPKGVLIKVGEDKAAPATTCPPSPPVSQPFEGN